MSILAGGKAMQTGSGGSMQWFHFWHNAPLANDWSECVPVKVEGSGRIGWAANARTLSFKIGLSTIPRVLKSSMF